MNLSELRPVPPSDGPNPLRDAALAYAKFGWRVFPVHGWRDGCCTCGNPDCDNPAKHPLTSHGLHDATVNDAVICRWWRQWPDANVAIRADDIGLVVDVDPRNGGIESLERIFRDHGGMPDTVEVLTGGGGNHFYLTTPHQVAKGKLPSYPGIDIQASGSYVIAPPSMHKSGQRYEFEASSDWALGQAVAECPAWILKLRGEVIERTRSDRPVPPLSEPPPAALADLQEALRFVDPDLTYPEWVKVGQAIHGALWTGGFELWDQWSAQGSKYPGLKKMRAKWSSFDANGAVTLATVFGMARDAGRVWKAPDNATQAAQAVQEASTRPKLAPRSAASWKDAPEPPPREWLWPEWIPMVQTTALYGDGGVGKTLAAQQLMTAVAAGLKVWHEDVRPGVALGIFCEDDEDELQRRQFAICESFGVHPAQLDNLHLLSRAGDDNLLMTFKDDVGHLTPFWHQVREMVGDIRPAVLTVDTAADTFGGNENIRPQVRQYVQGALTKLAIEFRCAVLLCAHPSVAGLTSGSGTGGSTAWNNSVRSRLYLSRDEVTQRLVLERKKSNYAKAGERIELMWQEGAFIRFATVPGQAMRTEADVEYEQLFLGLLREFTARGQGVGVDKRGNYAPREFGRAMREQGQSVNEMGLGMAMNRLLDMGVIEVKIDERLNAKRLAVVR
jgi:RecA-family ATPase